MLPSRRLPDWAQAYHGSNYDHLRRVKAAYDPHSFFASTSRSREEEP